MTQPTITLMLDPDHLLLSTQGAEQQDLLNLRIQLKTIEEQSAMEFLIDYLISFQLQFRSKLDPTLPFAFGSWILRFEPTEDGKFLDILELNQEGNRFVPGASFACQLWQKQNEMNEHFELEFTPPTGNQTILISKNVWDGKLPVYAERIPTDKKEHSGWFFYHSKEEQNRKNLFRYQSLYHLADIRPELLPFVAFPIGTSFQITESGIEVFGK